MLETSSKDTVDYSLYLVTGRDLVNPERVRTSEHSYYNVIEEAIKGGVTIVQVREKSCDTGEFLEIAQKTKAICRRYGVPILINDRIDIALAIGADGVHLGQTDMPISMARELLPKGSIIGVSCNTPQHAEKAVQDGADYIGIGAIWYTQTKQLTNPVVGVRGVGAILERLNGSSVKAVAIGGIKTTNLVRTLHGAVAPSGRALDGVAVVSDIMASLTPELAARNLSNVVQSFLKSPPPLFSIAFKNTYNTYNVENIVNGAAALLSKIRETTPLIHQITNNVVINQSANATLALGASPIMATAAPEMEDLSAVSGALLINFGTIGDKSGMLEAGRCANATRKPIVFDPVAVGATTYRRTAANELLNTWQATVIKGNAAEIGSLANSTEVQSKGVDSVGSGLSDPVSTIKMLALKERCIVVLTGITDWVSNGHVTVRLSNGHSLLGGITGSGCMVGTTVATFCAAARLSASQTTTITSEDPRLVHGDMLIAAVGGVLALTIASEYAAVRSDVKGTGTFLPALIDELYNLTPEKIKEKAQVTVM